MNSPAAPLCSLERNLCFRYCGHAYDTLRCFDVHEPLESQVPGWVAQHPRVNLTLHELSQHLLPSLEMKPTPLDVLIVLNIELLCVFLI